VSITTSADYEGVAFDTNGNLWVADISASQLIMFTPAQIVASGTPTPTVTISDSGSGALYEPVAVVFDNGGDLWVSTIGGTADNLLKYNAADLAATGSPAPDVVVSSNNNSFDWPQIVFDPPIVNP
jgi:DNA-binding beta-propeller fold protein YncE